MIFVGNLKIEQGHFPDNTLLMKLNPSDIEAELELKGRLDVKWLYESDAELFTLICVKRHLEQHYDSKCIQLWMPYIPHARMDRVKTKEDVFTLKYFCEIINSLHFAQVHVRDAHSNVSLALLENVVEWTVYYNVLQSVEKMCKDQSLNSTEDWMLFYPDEGALKRYNTNLPYKHAFGIKRRNWETGKIEGLDVAGCTEEIKDKVILIVDDICSRGGTFYHSAKKLKELGAKAVYLYVTHCENTILEGELLTSGLIEKIYTTKSIFTKEHEKIEVFEL